MLFDRKFGGIEPQYLFYTDGSFIRNSAGFGVYNIEVAHFFKLKSPCSIFVAELIALYFTCSVIEGYSSNLYIICTDSLSCLNAIKSTNFNFKIHYIIIMLRKLVYDLQRRGFIIKFVWVPAHYQIFGNEQADCLAKLGATRGIIYERNIFHSEYFAEIKQKSKSSWQIDWDCSDKGRWCHSICPVVDKKPWFKHLSTSRNFICLFSRLMSNHYISNSHLYRINIVDSNLCICGESYQDIDHIIFHCVHYTLPIKNLIDRFKSLGFSLPVSVRDILGCKSLVMMKILFRYFIEIGYAV